MSAGPDFLKRLIGREQSMLVLPFGLNSIGISADQFSNARRLLVLQFWRNLGPKKIDLPIAFCEAESVGRE